MSLRDQLQAIYDRNRYLTPQLVVEEARPKTHPLHSQFEWNDRIAGEKYREQQASELIRSVKISYKRKDDTLEQVRYFVSVEEGEGYAYHPADVVAKDDRLTGIVLRDMEREWRQLYARYSHFQEFTELVQKTMSGKRKKAA